MTNGSTKAEIEVANPVAEVRPEAIMPARRLDTLSGKKIALWWNTKSHGDVALSAAIETVERRFQNVSFERFMHHDGPLGAGSQGLSHHRGRWPVGQVCLRMGLGGPGQQGDSVLNVAIAGRLGLRSIFADSRRAILLAVEVGEGGKRCSIEE